MARFARVGSSTRRTGYTYFSLLTTLLTTHYSLLTTHYALRTTHYALRTTGLLARRGRACRGRAPCWLGVRQAHLDLAPLPPQRRGACARRSRHQRVHLVAQAHVGARAAARRRAMHAAPQGRGRRGLRQARRGLRPYSRGLQPLLFTQPATPRPHPATPRIQPATLRLEPATPCTQARSPPSSVISSTRGRGTWTTSPLRSDPNPNPNLNPEAYP